VIKTPHQGAQTSIYLAVSEDVKGVSGNVVSHIYCKVEGSVEKPGNFMGCLCEEMQR